MAPPAVGAPVADAEYGDESGGFMAALRDAPAWVVSLAVHLIVMGGLARMTIYAIEESDPVLTTSIEDVQPEEYKFDVAVTDMVGSDSDVNIIGPSQAAAEMVAQDPQKQLEEQLEQEQLEIETPNLEALPEPDKAEMMERFTATGSTEHPGGVEGAIDRLTLEIAGSLRERKTLAIWLFDESLSLKERRDTIAERFENVYRQLGVLGADETKAMKTAVASFGERTHIITDEPVEDVTELVEKVRTIPPDESGLENVFTAIQTVANKWMTYRTKMNRNVMIIVVTDERGDDYHLMDQVIAKLSRYGIKVYCVGNAAILGREKGYVTWTYEDGFQEELPVDQGPETVAPERLQLPFWGASGRGLERMSSGFGPYALTRLCAETNGLYLVAEESKGPKFDHAVMRNYLPDYRPIREYDAELKNNAAKRALVEVSTRTKVDSILTPRMAFRADTDNVLRQEITAAQRPAAEFDYKMREILTILEQGEKDRAKLDTARWQASYDLAMGRVLAMTVRAFGYNTVLADMKSNPKTFEKEGSNQWRLVPSNEVDAGPAVKKLKKKASEYLTRVVDDHPGTPWAMLAERELGTPMGWAWAENSVNLPSTGATGGANNKKNIQLANDEQRRREMQRRKAMERAKARPKL